MVSWNKVRWNDVLSSSIQTDSGVILSLVMDGRWLFMGRWNKTVNAEPTASSARQVQSTGASKTVVTRNIPYTNRSDLIKFFEQAGEVVKDNFNDRCHKGTCFIEFATYEAAEKALELDGQYLCNRKIGVAPLVAKALKTLAAKNLPFSTTKYDLKWLNFSNHIWMQTKKLFLIQAKNQCMNMKYEISV